MLNITTLLEEIKTSPYREIDVTAPHSGVVSFPDLKDNAPVTGPVGQWKEKPGTLLARIERERNSRPIHAPEKGRITYLARDLEGTFVEAGTILARIQHFLSKDEVLTLILKRSLNLFLAPERAKYYFTTPVDNRIKSNGIRSVQIHNGMEIFIMSRMKREQPVIYSGPGGVLYEVYFQTNQNVEAGMPLIGVCPEDNLRQIEDVVVRVQTEWKEQE
jgi:biotin carboxyl carrier protein